MYNAPRVCSDANTSSRTSHCPQGRISEIRSHSSLQLRCGIYDLAVTSPSRSISITCGQIPSAPGNLCGATLECAGVPGHLDTRQNPSACAPWRSGGVVGGEGIYDRAEFLLHKVHNVHANLIGNGRWGPWRSLGNPLSGLDDLPHPPHFLPRAEGGGAGCESTASTFGNTLCHQMAPK